MKNRHNAPRFDTGLLSQGLVELLCRARQN